jgi:TIR domain
VSDIFISYASEDRERAREIATVLTDNGWSVWWDRQIPFGKTFDKVIEENLAKAKCVVVLWTRNSVESRWVRAEASDGVGRDLLLPVVLERDLKLPLEFKMFQAANLADWRPGQAHEEFERFLKSVGAMVKAPPALAETDATKHADSKQDNTLAIDTLRDTKSKRALYLFGLLVLPSLTLIAAALGLMNWRMPTRVEIDLTVDRLAFTASGSEPVAILDKSASFRSLSVESFDSIAFKATRLLDAASGTVLDVGNDVLLHGRKEDLSIVTISHDEDAQEIAGRLEAISVAAGTQVILETLGGDGFTMRFDGQALTPAVLPLGTFRLNAIRVIAKGELAKTQQHAADVIALRAELAPDSPLIEVRGLPQSLVLTLTPMKNSAIQIFSKTGAQVRDIEFMRQNQSGGREPSLVAVGEIRFPDFPAKEKIAINLRDYVGLDQLDRFYISELALDPEGHNMRVSLIGVVGYLQTLAGAVREDRRLTRFDTLWYGSKTTVLFSILVWALTVTVGTFKLYKEFKS